MNQSEFLFWVKLQLGLLNLASPIENLDKLILDIIKTFTLPQFSIYCPLREQISLDVQRLTRTEKGSNYATYILPEFKGREIIDIYKIDYLDNHISGIGYFGGGMPLMTGNVLHQSMMANASNRVLSTMIPRITFDFKKPRTIKIFNIYNSCDLVFDIGFQHNFIESIPSTAFDSFKEFALLDIKRNLYPTLKHYNEVNSAYGNINLKIDDWANAESEFKELVEKWNGTYHLDIPNAYWF